MKTVDIINDTGAITLGQLFSILRRVKIGAMISILAFFVSVLGGFYTLGKHSQQKEIAVMLRSPFAMRLELEGKVLYFSNLTLIEDPLTIQTSDDTIVLSLREIKSDFDIVPVGNILARIKTENLSWPWSMFAYNLGNHDAYAATNFNMNGHQGDLNYSEKFIDNDTMNRFYSDGCVLEYKVDANRRSIPDSFRWVKQTH